MNDSINNIYKRRSIRSYLNKPVKKEIIIELLKAAMAAPTAANAQPWEFVVIQDKEKLNAIKKECIFARYDAPVAIVVCGNKKLAMKGKVSDVWIQDCSAATENILLAATSLGLGSLWIGVYPNNVDVIRKTLQLPEQVIPLSIVYVGYTADEKEARTRFNDKRVYWEEYDATRKHRSKDKPIIGHY